MNRRELLVLATAVPIGWVKFGTPGSYHTELMPHRMALPATTWEAIAFASQVTRRCQIRGGVVTNVDAQRIAQAIDDDWDDLTWHFNFYLGFDPNDASEQWLLGRGWEQRVRIAEAFFRGGGFRIEPQSDGVLLVRVDESDSMTTRRRL